MHGKDTNHIDQTLTLNALLLFKMPMTCSHPGEHSNLSIQLVHTSLPSATTSILSQLHRDSSRIPLLPTSCYKLPTNQLPSLSIPHSSLLFPTYHYASSVHSRHASTLVHWSWQSHDLIPSWLGHMATWPPFFVVSPCMFLLFPPWRSYHIYSVSVVASSANQFPPPLFLVPSQPSLTSSRLVTIAQCDP